MLGIDPGSLAAASSTVTFNSAPQPFTVSATSLTKNFIVSGGGSSETISGNCHRAPRTRRLTSSPPAITGSRERPNTHGRGGRVFNSRLHEHHLQCRRRPPCRRHSSRRELLRLLRLRSPSCRLLTLPLRSEQRLFRARIFAYDRKQNDYRHGSPDSTGSAVSNAGVFARPLSQFIGARKSVLELEDKQILPARSLSMSFRGHTSSVYSRAVVPNVPDQQITVPESGATTRHHSHSLSEQEHLSRFPVPLKTMAATRFRMRRQRAHVVSTSNTNPIGGGTGNFVGGPTIPNGAYTLYVDAGAWIVEAFAPDSASWGVKLSP